MKFEEQFPSLIKSNIYDENTIQRGGDLCGDVECVFTEDIEKHCLDKQRVRDVIGDVFFARGISPECNIINAVNREKERILKELGVDIE